MQKLRLRRNVQLGVKSLMLHKLQSFLTMLGMVFGVSSVIAMLSIGEGASKEALEQIRRLGSTNIIISAMKPIEDEDAASTQSAFMSIYGLLYEDEARIRESFPTVVKTAPVKQVREKARLYERTLDLRVVGTTPDWFTLVRRPVIAGRVMTPEDMESFTSICVLTEYGARRLLATEESIGQMLRLGGEYYQVIGIVQSESAEGGSLLTPDQEVDAYIPLNVARSRYGDIMIRSASGSSVREKVELHQIIVRVDANENVESTALGVRAMLERFHKKEDYHISIPLALLRQAEATKRTFNIVLGSIAGISLLVGGIGIMNIMLASVTERTREIGVRRAVGAHRKQIILQFLIETVVLSTSGGFIGIAIGISIPWLVTKFSGMPTVVTTYSLVLSVGISMAIGIVFGIYPAFRAANLDPIEALRHE